MLKIAICDDEIFFRNQIEELLEKYLKSNGILYEIDTFCSGAEFVELGIEMMRYKIVFLDINMEEMDGITTAKKIREVSRDLFLVFITAYVNYTLEGYKVDAVRYILKSNDNLEGAISECMDAIWEKANYKVVWQEFHFHEGHRKISLEHILYIESKLHKLEFHVMEQKLETYTLYDTLNRMEELLDENYFVRVHQSFLVNMKYIKSIKRNEVLLSNGMKFDIPRARYKGVEEKFVMYKGLI